MDRMGIRQEGKILAASRELFRLAASETAATLVI